MMANKKDTVKLRVLEVSDATQMAQLANNKKIWDNVRDRFPYPYSEIDAENFLQQQKMDSSQHNFAIIFRGDFCGVIGLILQEDVYKKSAEMGYWLGEPFWGRGIATEAVRQIIEYGFQNLGLIRIFAGVFAYNVGSMKVLEKNGFQKEGIAKRAVYKNAKIWDEHRYYKLNDP